MNDTHGQMRPNDSEAPSLPRLPGYQLLETLGAGASGTVFLATRTGTGARVAIKISTCGSDTRRAARFQREASLCARLHHPHIVRLLDKGEEGPYLYTIFDYVPGETLRDHLRRQRRLSATETVRLMAQVLDALDCAHRAGVVHRDLKPDNIMVTQTGALAHAMVLDFGVGTLLPQAGAAGLPAVTMTTEFVGTPSYAAPEQLRGESPDHRADIYSWGLIVLECLMGRAVFAGASQAEVFHRQLSAQELPLPLEIANHPLGTLLRRALRKHPEDRCPSAAALLVDLRNLYVDDLVGELAADGSPVDTILLRTQSTCRAFAEKRPITVLCGVVSVWPPLTGDTTDAEHLELAQRQEQSALEDAATRRGGMVAGTLGGHTLIVFGYPYACDTDTRRAGMTALDLLDIAQKRGATLQATCSARLSLRIGMHAGLGVVAPGDAPTGQVIQAAMRLAALAPPGAVLISEHCAGPLRTANLCVVPADPPTIDDMPTWRTFLLRPQTQEVGDPERLHAVRIGREVELSHLIQAWEGAEAQRGSVVVVRGEPGIGKSCLAESLATHLQAAGARVLRAHCLPEHRHSAFAPVLRLLRQHVGADLAGSGEMVLVDRLQSALAAAGCDAEQVMPVFCAWLSLPFGAFTPSQASPALQKRLLLHGVVRWLVHLSRQVPTALVLEDLHWADPTTVEWLEALSAEIRGERLMVVLTARPAWSWPDSLQAQSITLDRLDPDQAAAVVRHALAPHEPDSLVVDHVVARTDGIPLFIREYAKAIAASHLCEKDGRWTFRDGAHPAEVPTTLRDSLIARFHHLEGARKALQIAATIGSRFEIDLLQQCLGDADAADTALRMLREAGIVAEVTGADTRTFVFHHALIRGAAYDCMLAAQRRHWHRVVAQTMTQLRAQLLVDEPDVVAQHHAQAGEYAEAVALGIRQLGLTQRRSLNDDTLAYAHQVESWIVQLPPDRRDALRLDVTGYETQALMNKFGWAHPQVEERIERSQHLLTGTVAYEQEVRHLWSMITYHHVASHRPRVRALTARLTEIAQEHRDDNVLVAAATYAGLADYSDGRFVDAERGLSDAIARYDTRRHAHHATTLGFDTRVWACAGRALVRWFAGHEGSTTDAEQAVAWGRESRHLPSLCMALMYHGLGLQARDDRQVAAQVTDELIGLAVRHDLPAFHGYAQIIRSWASDDIEQADQTVDALWRMGCRYCQTYYRAFAADTLASQGRLEDALARVDHCLVLVDQLEEQMYAAELHLARGRYLRASGAAPAEEAAALRRAVELARASGKRRTMELAESLLMTSMPSQRACSLLSPIPSTLTLEMPHVEVTR